MATTAVSESSFTFYYTLPFVVIDLKAVRTGVSYCGCCMVGAFKIGPLQKHPRKLQLTISLEGDSLEKA